MSLDRKRWALMAQDLKFSQLDTARKQADTWRAGLATLTALLTGVLVVKGRNNASDLTRPFQVLVAALLGVALILLLWATMWLSRALAGPPGEKILLSGENLADWTQGEVRKISTALRWAPGMAAVSVIVVAIAIAFTWFGPAPGTTAPLVQVTESTGQQSCGALLGVSKHELILRSTAAPTLVPVSVVDTITPVTACP